MADSGPATNRAAPSCRIAAPDRCPASNCLAIHNVRLCSFHRCESWLPVQGACNASGLDANSRLEPVVFARRAGRRLRILSAMSDSPPLERGEGEQCARAIRVDHAQGMQIGDRTRQSNRFGDVAAGRDALVAQRDLCAPADLQRAGPRWCAAQNRYRDPCGARLATARVLAVPGLRHWTRRRGGQVIACGPGCQAAR